MSRIVVCPTCRTERAVTEKHDARRECGVCARRRVWQGHRLEWLVDLVRRTGDVVQSLQRIARGSQAEPQIVWLARLEGEVGELAEDVMVARLAAPPAQKVS